MVEGLPIRGVPVPVEAGAHLQQLGQGGHRDGVEWTGQTFVLLMLKYLLIRLFHSPGKGFVVINACNNVCMYVHGSIQQRQHLYGGEGGRAARIL